MTCSICGRATPGRVCAGCRRFPQAAAQAVALLGLLGCSGDPETPHPPVPEDDVEPAELIKAIYGPPPVDDRIEIPMEPVEPEEPEVEEPTEPEPPAPAPENTTEPAKPKPKAEVRPPEGEVQALYGIPMDD
ncbi:MAG: hypothetical protein EP330_28955 [Deltaproteobacteria bacterium]|nr:MAG: hypothetical protein EP330_28955 [Deltaproteobacteria bacterium]